MFAKLSTIINPPADAAEMNIYQSYTAPWKLAIFFWGFEDRIREIPDG
jgi:hypothetical protein